MTKLVKGTRAMKQDLAIKILLAATVSADITLVEPVMKRAA